jgi:hypothetical protein
MTAIRFEILSLGRNERSTNIEKLEKMDGNFCD